MAGRGGLVRKGNAVKKEFDAQLLQHKFERELVIPDGNVERLTTDMRWVPAIEPMHVDIDTSKSCGIGPGLIFARMIGGQSRLVPCAVGGTKIDEWAEDTPLYLQMIKRAQFAQQNIDALLWYQGESDALHKEDSAAYLTKLVDLVQRMRRDLADPNLPIIMVAIWCSLERCPQRDDIRNAIFTIPELLPNVHVVDAQHSQLQDDNIHLTSEAQYRLASQFTHTFNTKL